MNNVHKTLICVEQVLQCGRAPDDCNPSPATGTDSPCQVEVRSSHANARALRLDRMARLEAEARHDSFADQPPQLPRSAFQTFPRFRRAQHSTLSVHVRPIGPFGPAGPIVIAKRKRDWFGQTRKIPAIVSWRLKTTHHSLPPVHFLYSFVFAYLHKWFNPYLYIWYYTYVLLSSCLLLETLPKIVIVFPVWVPINST